MIETPLFFPQGEHSLFGILHQPGSAASRSGFVFCHPFGEEKLWAHRVFVSFARQLAAQGHPVLRFDYMGNGDSGGEFAESSLTTAQADVRCAIGHLRQTTGVETVGLVGLRLGATIASLVAERTPDVERLGPWAPVIDGARYIQELLRINLMTQMAIYREVRQDREALIAALQSGQMVNVDGYELTLPMFTEMTAVKLAAEPKRFPGRCLVTHVDRQTARIPAELQQLADRYPQAALRAAEEEPFWKEIARFYNEAPNLTAVTTEWLQAS